MSNYWKTFIVATLLPMVSFAQTSNETTDTENKEDQVSNISTYEVHHLIDGQLKDLSRGDFSQAYFVYTSSYFRSASSLAAFTQFAMKYADFWKNAKIDFDNITKEGNLLKIKGILSTNNQQLQVTYYLIKQGTQWKILGVNLSQVPAPNPNLTPAPES